MAPAKKTPITVSLASPVFVRHEGDADADQSAKQSHDERQEPLQLVGLRGEAHREGDNQTEGDAGERAVCHRVRKERHLVADDQGSDQPTDRGDKQHGECAPRS